MMAVICPGRLEGWTLRLIAWLRRFEFEFEEGYRGRDEA
jgi:hypothetical protein